MAHRKICCGVDFSPRSLLAVAEAADLADLLGAELLVVHVHGRLPLVATDLIAPSAEQLDEEARFVEGELARCRTAAEAGRTIRVRTVTLVGEPADELVRFAKDEGVDLVVVGTHGRTGVGRAVLGSVAERVVRHAECPVLVVRPTAQQEERATRAEVEQYTG